MKFPSLSRQIFGACLILVSIVVSAVIGVRAHQETLRLSTKQDLVYAVLDSDAYPMAAMDHTGKILLWNDALEKLSGYTDEEVMEKGLSVVFPNPTMYSRHQDKAMYILSDQTIPPRTAIARCKMKTKAGKIIPVIVTVYIYDSISDGRFALARISTPDKVVDIGDSKLANGD